MNKIKCIRGSLCFCQDGELGGKRAGAQPAKDVAEALGIAAGVQSGRLGAAEAPAPLDPAQRQVSADPRVPRRCHQPPHGHIKTEKKNAQGAHASAVYICMQAHKHVLLALSTHTHTHTL